MDYYEESIEALKTYLKENNKIPSETQWNFYALEHEYLSSKTIGYIYGLGFNRICRKLIKKA